MVQIAQKFYVHAGKLGWEPRMFMGDSGPSRELQTPGILINTSQN